MENENIVPVIEEPVIEKPIVPQVPSVSSEQEKKSNLFKILIIFLGILIALGLFANAYLMFSKKETVTKTSDISVIPTPTSDSTANWKTYTNDVYQYTFNYPDGYDMSKKRLNKNGVSIEEIKWTENWNTKPTSFYIYSYPKSLNQELIIKDIIKDITILNTKSEKIKLLNQEVNKTTYTSGGFTVIMIEPIKNRETYHTFVYNTLQGYSVRQSEEFGQILSTFELLD